MPYKLKRVCPICYKPELLYLSDHLRQVHGLPSADRRSYLKKAIFSHPLSFNCEITSCKKHQTPTSEQRISVNPRKYSEKGKPKDGKTNPKYGEKERSKRKARKTEEVDLKRKHKLTCQDKTEQKNRLENWMSFQPCK